MYVKWERVGVAGRGTEDSQSSDLLSEATLNRPREIQMSDQERSDVSCRAIWKEFAWTKGGTKESSTNQEGALGKAGLHRILGFS